MGVLASYFQSEEVVHDSHSGERASSASGTVPRFDNQTFEDPPFSTLFPPSLSVFSPDSFGFVTPLGKRLIRHSGDLVAIEKKYNRGLHITNLCKHSFYFQFSYIFNFTFHFNIMIFLI